MIEFKLPSLGADMDKGKLLEWRVKPGDPVKRGDIVAVVDTSKVAVDVEIWNDGTVYQLIAQPGVTIPVGTVIATLLAPGETAEALAADGIAAEVVDLRVLRPLDDATVMASVCKCRRALIVDEGWRSGSLAAELMARIVEQAFFDLDAPPARVCSEEVPIPYASHMEEAALPQPAKIVAAARALMGQAP